MQKKWLIFFLTAVVVSSIFIVVMVQVGHVHKIYKRNNAKIDRSVALVLGASLKFGKPSVMLADRLDTATDLYVQERIKKIIVSGDNRTYDYNEPLAMKKYLVEHGIPAEDIIPDYAGRRTYDSCYRLKEIFGQTSAVIITQQFHLPRALYLCDHLGVDTIGVQADTSQYNSLAAAYIREFFASLKAWLDISILKPTPVLGNKESVF